MKLITLIIVILSFTAIFTKDRVSTNKNEVNSKGKEQSANKGIEHVPDAISNAYAHNDPYILQNQAVTFKY
jgi:hypothetical protein